MAFEDGALKIALDLHGRITDLTHLLAECYREATNTPGGDDEELAELALEAVVDLRVKYDDAREYALDRGELY